MFAAQSYAFHYILKIDIERYPLFLLTGLLPWAFIQASIDMSTSSLVNNGRFLKSFPVSPAVIVSSQIIDNFINYMASFIIILIPIAIWLEWPLVNLIYMIPSFFSLFLFVVSFSFFMAALNVFFRDTRFVMTFVMQITFYMTPIFYPADLIPEQFRWLNYINFFYLIIYPFQMLHSTFEWSAYWSALSVSYFISISALLICKLFWRLKRNEIYFSL
jgi:lipopolysaccharide transport system permease protein